jgi:acetyl esterase/lipase
MIVAPGGAFHFLMVDHEGYDMARWLVERGITAGVLKYRLAPTPENDAEMEAFRTGLQARLGRAQPTDTEPPDRDAAYDARRWGEEDGRQAIRFVRAHADAWSVDPHRIGIAGFSAGGGVAMGPVFEHDAQSRPDFAAAIYPAYRAGQTVPEDAPPLFLAIADNDASVAPVSAARLYEAWHRAGKPAELHIFGSGAHGFGMARGGLLSDPWIELLGNWLRSQNLMESR